ncbi:hypothetical protein I312_105029 [Cryptococcus bacillisporus CA1280]|uniref:uncharacterized protein n=1 Tax=Cryptococcus bacillisporus CA1280 TaxID=1296109 RepID=UPI0033672709
MGSELRTGSEDCFDDDDFPAAPGGKKRKVPAYGQVKSADEINDTKPSTPLFPLKHRFPRTPAYSLCEFRKGLFLRRKAAFIALYIDAQTAINASSLKHKSTLPEVTSFEKLLPSLEDVGVNSWTPDRSGWREDRAESWRIRCGRKKSGSTMRVERKGWAPEGSFEFEMECQAYELRGVVLATNKPAPVTRASSSTEDKPPSKNKRKLDKKAELPLVTPQIASPPLSQTPSRDDSVKTKKKSKKKKRSVLANQSNPHHVDNYPYEPWPNHFDLISPPSMRFLATRPQRATVPLPGAPQRRVTVRPSEEDYICCFCEYDLYYGSEKARKRAIRRRRRELKRKEAIKAKAKNVAEGKGVLKDDSEEDDDDDECDDDGHGQCGRALPQTKPLETDAG